MEKGENISWVKLMKGEKLNLEICLRGVIFVVFNAANSVGTSLEFVAFGCSPTPTLKEFVHSGFFWSTIMVFAAVRAHFPTKTPAFILRCDQ